LGLQVNQGAFGAVLRPGFEDRDEDVGRAEILDKGEETGDPVEPEHVF